MSRCFMRRGLLGSGGSRRPFFLGLLLVTLSVGGCELRELPPGESAASPADTTDAPAAIVAMLHASAGSWNAGDLDGFMDDYWRSDALTFSGSGGVTRGWEKVRERYRSSYFAPEMQRDHLQFEDLEVSLLGLDHALALGRYRLSSPQDTSEVRSSGYFSLVLRRIDGEWRIVHDHTSAAPPPGGA